MRLISGERVNIFLSGSPEPVLLNDSRNRKVYSQNSPGTDHAEINLTIQGDGTLIWPNREGERFHLKEAHEKLRFLGRELSGISICWPATASTRAVSIHDGDTVYTFSAGTDSEGRAFFLNLSSEKQGAVCFRFTGAVSEWTLSSSKSFKMDPDVKEPRNSETAPASIYQIGLIGPEGNSEVPRGKGFSILADAAEALREKFGDPSTGDILHVFGYGEGHDRGYPDYRPSEKLGGSRALEKAIGKLHNLGFEISLYMNARLAELSRLQNYTELKDSVLIGSDGRQITEKYHGREFAVMNPSSPEWTEHLFNESRRLGNLGADWVQLDQVAGRAAVVKPGEEWGAGYRKLIERIQDSGMKVWIQGVSCYYPADAFEATWRPVKVLSDGTLRGGFPLGTPDTELIESRGFRGKLIVPESKREALKNTGLPVLQDRSASKDELPLWGESWLQALKTNNYSRIPGEFNGGIQ